LTSLPRAYFDDVYRENPDPWGFRTRSYEARKRELTMAMLPDPAYRSVFEPGCSIGVLSAMLAKRSERLLAMDISAQALKIAAAGLPSHVELRQGTPMSSLSWCCSPRSATTWQRTTAGAWPS